MLASGYANRLGRDWIIGENIAWGQGVKATPRSTVMSWMASDGHRRNILNDQYAEVGIGIALGAPVDAHWGATYTTDFGVLGDTRAQSCTRAHGATAERGALASGGGPAPKAATAAGAGAVALPPGRARRRSRG